MLIEGAVNCWKGQLRPVMRSYRFALWVVPEGLNMAMAHVAAVLDSLNDSHTFLIPLRRPYILDHGWQVGTIGNQCYVVRVKPGGDADNHGVKPGDQVLAINGYRVTRDNLWKIEFAFNLLRPQPQITVTLRNSLQLQERRVVLEAMYRKLANLKDLDNPDTFQDLEMEEENWSNEQRVRMKEFGNDLRPDGAHLLQQRQVFLNTTVGISDYNTERPHTQPL